MSDATLTDKTGEKGLLYFTGLFVLGFFANVFGLYLGFRLGSALNSVLASMGVVFSNNTWVFLPFLLAVLFWGLAAAAVIGTSVSKVGRFMGGHMVVTVVLAFTTIITVNLALAYNAVQTFPGLDEKNSFVASQNFDADRAAQEALGWVVDASHEGDTLRLTINGSDGKPAFPSTMEATLGAATHVRADQPLEFTHDGKAFVAKINPLTRGNWNIRVRAEAADGTKYRQRLLLHVN